MFFLATEGTTDGDWSTLIRKLRKGQGLSQTQLGEMVGITAAYISHIEAGKRNPSVKVCRRLLEALGAYEEASKL